MSALGQTGPLARRVLPKGRNAASREVVWESQHARMLEAMAAAVADQGYAATSVADVISRAGVSRKTFYEHFANREDCFLAAYDAGANLLLDAIDEAVEAAAPDWLEALHSGLRCFLGVLAANPAFARTFLIEVLAAGPRALEHRALVRERFAQQLAVGHRAARRDLPHLPELPEYIFRACVGAVDELVCEHLARHEAATLPVVLPQLLHVELSLYTGHSIDEAASMLSPGAVRAADRRTPAAGACRP